MNQTQVILRVYNMIKASSLDSLTTLEAINSWKTIKFTVANMSIIK